MNEGGRVVCSNAAAAAAAAAVTGQSDSLLGAIGPRGSVECNVHCASSCLGTRCQGCWSDCRGQFIRALEWRELSAGGTESPGEVMAIDYRRAAPGDLAACIEIRGKTRQNAVSARRLVELGITEASWAAQVEASKPRATTALSMTISQALVSARRKRAKWLCWRSSLSMSGKV